MASQPDKTITVEQIGSPIRRPAVQRQTLIGLGLNKMHKRRTLIDSPQVRGMVAKISHLVRIVDDEGAVELGELLHGLAEAPVSDVTERLVVPLEGVEDERA